MKRILPKKTHLLAAGILASAPALQAATLLQDNFATDSTPATTGRVTDATLNSGWRKTSGYGAENTPSAWTITGGQMQNPTAAAPVGTAYTESESPVFQWFSNPTVGSNLDGSINISFNYNVGTGDTLTMHFWAVTSGGTAGANNFITNNQGWQNGNSGQNQTSSQGGNTPYNLANGSNAPTNGDVSGDLTGSGTYNATIELATLTNAIPGVTNVGDIDSFFIAFAMNETGGGTTSIDNLLVQSVPEPSTTAILGLAGITLLMRRKK